MKRTVSYLILAVLIWGCGSGDHDIIVEPEVCPGIKYPKEILVDSVQNFQLLPTGQAEANRLGLRFSFSDFTPTGVYVESNSTLKLNVKLRKGDVLPSLVIGTYSNGDDWNTTPKEIFLNQGMNEINVGELSSSGGGLVYLRFTSDNEVDGEVEVRFVEGWKHSPLYKKSVTSIDNWQKMLATFKDIPSVTLIGNKAFLVVSREKAIEYQDKKQDELLASIDEAITIQNDLSGMDSSKDIHKPCAHKLLMAEYSGTDYYMFAYNYRTAYNNEGVKYILDPDSFTYEGWGPWHELGHMHQMSTWTWGSVLEGTVNLYSLAVENARGIRPNRLQRDNTWEEVEKYLTLPNDQKDFNGDLVSVWVRLCMFYQLQLAFGDQFLKDLHKSIREKKYPVYSDTDMMRVFMLETCTTSGHDLSDFFKSWGLKFEGIDEVYNEIASYWLTKPEVDPSGFRE